MKNPIDIYSTKDYKKVEAVVQLMVDGKVTSYRVATETDISKMSLATLTKGTSKIKNITYQTAMLLIEWYDNPDRIVAGHLHLRTYFFENQEFVLKIPIKFAIVEHI